MTATVLGARPTRPPAAALRGLTWVTWRQHRLGIGGVAAVFGALGLFLVISGLAVHHSFTNLGLNSCGTLDSARCQTQLTAFEHHYQPLADHLPQLLTFLPALIGVFIGAPLVARELESGTFRFAWSQSRTRTQWIVTKLALLGLVLTALALAFSALFTWWYAPFDAVSGRMAPWGGYEVSGLVFAARTVFAFTLGAMLGLLTRRTVPAMAATGACWTATVWSSVTYLRPLIRQPVTTIGRQGKGSVPGSGAIPANADIVNQWVQDATGQHVSFDQLEYQAITANHGTPPTPDQLDAYLTQHHYSQWISYRPDNWFWHFQSVETAGYAILAVLLAAATVLTVRRRGD